MSCFGRTLDALAALCAPGSLLAFDYPDEGFFTASERRVQCTVRMAAAGGEPMRSSFSRAALEEGASGGARLPHSRAAHARGHSEKHHPRGGRGADGL